MSTRFPRWAVLALFAVLLWTGCGQMPPFEALFDDSPEALGTGITGAGLVRAVVIIARYKATPRQREIAQVRARKAYAKLVAEEPAPARKRAPAPTPAPAKKRAPAATPEPVVPSTKKPAAAEKPAATPKPVLAEKSPAAAAAPAEEPEPPEAAPAPKPKKKKVPRYIAVDTAPDERSKGARSVMIFDTYSQEIVGNDVYDIESAPKLLQTAKFDTFAAQYVGSGSF